MDDWDRVTQLLDSHRTQIGHVWQASIALVLGLITVIGFAVDRQSWGLGGLAIFSELCLVGLTEAFRHCTPRLLDTAAELELEVAGDSRVVDAHRAGLELAHLAKKTRYRLIAAFGISIHVVLVAVVATSSGWTFAGT